MVCIGARFDDRVTGKLTAFAPNSKKIHIDIDPSSINKNVRVDVGIVGDCGSVLTDMIAAWKAARFTTAVDVSQPISIMRQVQIVAGSLALAGALLAWLVSPWFMMLSGFVGAGLMFAGLSDTCMMAMLLAKLPYNRPKLSAPQPLPAP
jgi:rhodanese-related sulfurtransferase